MIVGLGSKECLRGSRRLNFAYGEFRRLTMRGERLLNVRTALSLAHCASNCSNQRCRFLGCPGGKSPALGLRCFQDVQVRDERLIGVFELVTARALVQ